MLALFASRLINHSDDVDQLAEMAGMQSPPSVMMQCMLHQMMNNTD